LVIKNTKRKEAEKKTKMKKKIWETKPQPILNKFNLMVLSKKKINLMVRT